LVIKLGDSITQSINDGLANAKYGIVIISPVFLQKNWTIVELNTLTNMFITSKRKILPIWHNVTYDDIEKSMPLLLDIKAAKSSDKIDSIIHQIEDSIGKPERKQYQVTNYNWKFFDFTEFLQIKLINAIKIIPNEVDLAYTISTCEELQSYLNTLDRTKMTVNVLKVFNSTYESIDRTLVTLIDETLSENDC
jgi:hypothetical protein